MALCLEWYYKDDQAWLLLLPGKLHLYQSWIEFRRLQRSMNIPKHTGQVTQERLEVKGLWEAFSLVWMSGHQCYNW
jgi:hypothetical protein